MSSEAAQYGGGISVALVSTSCSALGMALQKSVHKRREAAGKAGRTRPYWREPRWLAGIGLMLAGSLLSLAVFALLGQSRASAMAAITIVINAALSRYFLGEPFGRVDAATTAFICTGTVVSVVFGSNAPNADIDYDVAVIVGLLQRDAVYIATAVFAAIVLLCNGCIYALRRRGAARTHLQNKLLCFVLGFTAGIFSGTTGFATKSSVVCVEGMVRSGDASDLTRWEFYAFVLGLPLSLFLQLRYLNMGLRYGDALEVIPVYQSSIVSVGVAFGWVYFNEGAGTPPLNMAMFAVGCGISVAGVSLLFLKERKPAPVMVASHSSEEGAGTSLLAAEHASYSTAGGSGRYEGRQEPVVTVTAARPHVPAPLPHVHARHDTNGGSRSRRGSASPAGPASPEKHLRRTEGGAVAAASLDLFEAAEAALATVSHRRRSGSALSAVGIV